MEEAESSHKNPAERLEEMLQPWKERLKDIGDARCISLGKCIRSMLSEKSMQGYAATDYAVITICQFDGWHKAFTYKADDADSFKPYPDTDTRMSGEDLAALLGISATQYDYTFLGCGSTGLLLLHTGKDLPELNTDKFKTDAEMANRQYWLSIEAYARELAVATDKGKEWEYSSKGHITRIRHYTELLLKKAYSFSDEHAMQAGIAAMLHDAGKCAIDIVNPELLRKRENLSNKEMWLIRQHPLLGGYILGSILGIMPAAVIAREHHEHCDGTGYPFKLRGEEISLAAQAVHLADVYDALREPRSYKPELAHEAVVNAILKGTPDRRTLPQHFDPVLVEFFRENNALFDEIYTCNRNAALISAGHG